MALRSLLLVLFIVSLFERGAADGHLLAQHKWRTCSGFATNLAYITSEETDYQSSWAVNPSKSALLNAGMNSVEQLEAACDGLLSDGQVGEIYTITQENDPNCNGCLRMAVYAATEDGLQVGAVTNPSDDQLTWVCGKGVPPPAQPPCGGEIKIGAILQSTGSGALGMRALQLWADWANSDANTLGFTVTLDVHEYNASTLAADVQALIDAPNHVLIPPYGSTGSIAFIDAVPADAAIPIMVWGGASDSIFSTACVGKHCFGMFTVGSEYMIPGLTALLAKTSAPLTVGMIQNDNSFSASVCDGAVDYIMSTHGLVGVPAAMVTVTRGDMTDDDKAAVSAAIAENPDIWVICGHSGGDVEDVIMQIGAEGQVPKAIIATNSITSGAAARFESMGHADLMNGLLMPTQWAMSGDMMDPNVGWTTDMFIAAFGDDASYHSASAAAAGLALTEAMAMAGATPDALAANLANVDMDTFYGHVAFNDDGSIAKPMYVQQMQEEGSPVFTTMYGGMMYPLSLCPGWGSPPTCGDIKGLYRAQSCCGMADQEVSVGVIHSELLNL